MTGYLYLGKKKVCPAILIGSAGEEPAFNFPITTNANGELIADENFVFKTGSSVEDIPYQSFQSVWSYVLSVIPPGMGISGTPDLVGADLSSIKRLTNDRAFSEAFTDSNIEYIDFSGLEVISGDSVFNEMLRYCETFERIDFSSLREVTGRAPFVLFANDTSIEAIEFPSLETLTSQGAFAYAFVGTPLKTMSFSALKASSFTSEKTQFDTMLGNVAGCTLHFPSNLSSVIPTLDGYPNFNGTNTVILYDLPATE